MGFQTQCFVHMPQWTQDSNIETARQLEWGLILQKAVWISCVYFIVKACRGAQAQVTVGHATHLREQTNYFFLEHPCKISCAVSSFTVSLLWG